ncbi:MAG: leucine-rich repeat domain-containing protein [Schleiferiaceae bacterium]|nr:leucine-rich repeat domain-containing protein [Schleiferiaceae bacterium]
MKLRIEKLFFILCLSFLCLGLSKPDDGIFSSLEKALADPQSVKELRLKRKKLKSLPSEIDQFQHLKVLDVRKNQLTELPETLVNCAQLEVLLLGKNKFTKIPNVVFDCNNLQRLSLSSNKISHFPSEIQNLQQLAYLDFFDTYIEHLPIEALQKMPNLKELDLRRTFVFTPEAKAYNEVLPQLKIQSNPGCDCNNPKKKIKK